MDEITERFVAGLYDRHIEALRIAVKEQRELRTAFPTMRAQLDDIEAEITYLLLRELRPMKVVEIGALHGWSTTWILRALRDTGHGHLHTVDRVDHSVRQVPPDLSAGRWTFVHGDVRRRLADRGIPYFTAAPAAASDVHARLQRHRVRLGLVEPIGSRTANPMVFFRTGVRPAGAMQG
jgi:hypothetical protein